MRSLTVSMDYRAAVRATGKLLRHQLQSTIIHDNPCTPNRFNNPVFRMWRVFTAKVLLMESLWILVRLVTLNTFGEETWHYTTLWNLTNLRCLMLLCRILQILHNVILIVSLACRLIMLYWSPFAPQYDIRLSAISSNLTKSSVRY